MKKVLIITYYWPPSGGSQVLRWLKFVKYFREFGWEPVIYTPENPEAPETDTSNLKDIPENIEIIKTRIREPYRVYKIFLGKKKNEKLSTAFLSEDKKGKKLTGKIALWIRSNFFIPDARRFWIKPSVRYLTDYLKKHPVEAIVTTGPPHSMHLIGLHLKKKTNISWLADFRDPWTNIDFYKELLLTSVADKKHHKLEKRVVTTADCVLTVGNTMTEEFRELGARKIFTLTNGFDADDLPDGTVTEDEEFSIVHIGTIPQSRNCDTFWKVLAELIREKKGLKENLRVRLIGRIDNLIMNSFKNYDLSDYVEIIDYIPHQEAIRLMKQSRVLLLLINNTPNAKGILTNKFFEYLSVQKPVLAIGPEDGDIAAILTETNAGDIAGYDNYEKMKQLITDNYYQYISGKSERNFLSIDNYSRKNLTGKLAGFLNEMIR